MTKRKIKTIKFKVLSKNEVVSYQTVIESIIGDKISTLSCYDDNNDHKNTIGKTYVNDNTSAYFNPDCDYEIIIRPIK